MPKVSLELIEELPDSRSDEFTFRLVVKNSSAKAIRILSVTPRVPEGGTLLKIQDSGRETAKADHDSICQELTHLAQAAVLPASKELRESLERSLREIVKNVASIDGTFAIYTKFFSGTLNAWAKEQGAHVDATIPRIKTLAAAMSAYEKWFAADASVGPLFKHKLEQLAALTEKLETTSTLLAIATVDPDASFVETYVLRIRRAFVNTRRVNFSVDVAHTDGDDGEQHGNATIAAVVTARAYVLVPIAALGAAMGTILKTSLTPTAVGLLPREYAILVGKNLITGQGVSAMVLALVFYNAYEFTGLGAKLRVLAAWRGALVIGTLCGLATERVVAALRALIGQ